MTGVEGDQEGVFAVQPDAQRHDQGGGVLAVADLAAVAGGAGTEDAGGPGAGRVVRTLARRLLDVDQLPSGWREWAEETLARGESA